MLPYLGEKSVMRPSVRTGFGGLDHNLSAGDGEIYWMENLSSREYPLMTPRVPRVNTFLPADDMGAVDELFYTFNGEFYYSEWGTDYLKGYVTRGQKQFVSMGNKILIFPDKAYYDTKANVFGSLQPLPYGNFRFENGTYAGEPAEGNTLFCSSWSRFRVGDAVTISGCLVHPENNKTVIIRELDENHLRFYENTFNVTGYTYTVGAGGMAAGTYHFDPGYKFTLTSALSEGATLEWQGTKMKIINHGPSSTVDVTAGTQGTEITLSETEGYRDYSAQVARLVPSLDFWCVNENRLWGCKGDTIYASALGDPFNFNVFDGLSTDSWQSETEGKGDFTGCVSYGGYPIFFKEDCIIKVQGDKPSNFQWTLSSRFGVKAGCGKSLAVAGETLFYVSPAGVCAYNGGAPRVISEALGRNETWSNAVGGSDGIRYYVSMQDSSDNWHLFIYDTRYGEWFREDDSHILSFVWFGGEMYMLNAAGARPAGDLACDGSVYREYGGASYWAAQTWTAEFADSTRFYETTDTGSQDKKGPLRLQLRCSMAQGATVKAWIMYDSDGTWQEIGSLTGETGGSTKRSYILPLIIRRCDHYRLKLTGTGESVIYSLTEVRYGGSNLQGGSVTLPSGN